MFRNYFKTAWRNIIRNKIYSFIHIAGLCIGLTCVMLIALYVKDEVSYDRFHKNAGRIYRITASVTSSGSIVDKKGSTSMMMGPGFQQDVPEIEDFVRMRGTSFAIKKGNDVFEQKALYADANFFSFFSFPLIKGNAQTALTGIHNVVLSEDMAEKYFGKNDAIGKTIELNTGSAFEPFIVSAIAKNAPQNSSIPIQMIIPLRADTSTWKDKHWANFFLKTFVTLKAGANPRTAEAKFDNIFDAQAGEQLKASSFTNTIKFHLQPLTQMHLSTEYPPGRGLEEGSNPLYSYILSGIALLILFIACINFINLTVAHSLKRAKEIGIRKVIGSQRKQLIIHFLGESFILSFIAFLLAVLLTQLSLPLFNKLANKSLSLSYLSDTRLVAVYVALFLLTGLLAGFYPAVMLSRFNPVQALYGKFKLSGKDRLSKSLVVFQFTLSAFLIAATIIIYTQFRYLTHFNLGYNDKNIVVVNTGKDGIYRMLKKADGQMSKNQLDVLRNELLKNRLIENVTAYQGGTQESTATVNDIEKVTADFRYIDERYFQLFHIPVIAGRTFSRSFATDTSSAIVINQSFAKAAGWKNAIGKQVELYDMHKKYTVIGVIKDYHYASLSEKVAPQLFITDPMVYTYGTVFIKLKPDYTRQTLDYVEKTFKQFFPSLPYEYNFKEVENARQYEKEVRWKNIILYSAVLAMFISCIGLFGLTTLAAEKRTKEIGIRKVLGASVAGIVTKLLSSFLRLVLMATVIAFPVAWWAMHLWLQNYPYRTAISWWMFGFAEGVVLVIALITISFQAIKAALANPIKSLRTE